MWTPGPVDVHNWACYWVVLLGSFMLMSKLVAVCCCDVDVFMRTIAPFDAVQQGVLMWTRHFDAVQQGVLVRTGPVDAVQQGVLMWTTGPLDTIRQGGLVRTTWPFDAVQQGVLMWTTGPVDVDSRAF